MTRRGWWGGTMTIAGCVCLVGVAIIINELVTLLPYLPEHWWRPGESVRSIPGGIEIDLRTMNVDFAGVGWLGSWGYMPSFLWIPVALFFAIQARRRGEAGTRIQHILLASNCILLLATLALVHFTPLHYPQYNVPFL